MPNEPQYESRARRAAQKVLNELRAELTPKGSEPVSWFRVAEAVNSAAAHEGQVITGETLRKLGELAIGGKKPLDALRRYMQANGKELDLGEDEPAGTTRTERIERYPAVELVFARARAAKVEESILDAVRVRVGLLKSTEGPTEAAVEQLIVEELDQRDRLSKLFRSASSGTEATDLDNFQPPDPPRAKSGTVARQRPVDAAKRRASMKR